MGPNPKEIENLIKIWEPYGLKIYNNDLEGVPKEAIEAFNKFKKWAWEQEL